MLSLYKFGVLVSVNLESLFGMMLGLSKFWYL